ncbi:MAG: Maltokinase [uncultured Nocardioidaceae bacterium]|uniref:Maltokinase n=1 Tax=uncultured Nocardioidaceae bacterium TaxID=253824 RepID=A0A6J4MGH3_9ACTN|nr:MAG: Maltokinase [uncultured Nocardioidaceae bacterium]
MSALEQFIGSARWFGGKGREFTVTEIRRLAWLNPPKDGESSLDRAADGETPRVRIELVTVQYADQPADAAEAGSTETYQVPLAYYGEAQERLDHALVQGCDDPELGEVFVYDALHDRNATALWLAAFDQEWRSEDLTFYRLPGHELDLGAHSTLFSGEQSNSSLMFGDDSLMKVFRKVTPGQNPDIEVHKELTRAESEHVAALYGWLEAAGRKGEEPLQLAMLQQFLRTASDGWELALASVRDLFAEADLHAEEVGGDFAAESRRLGVATAQVHDSLAERFPTRRLGAPGLGTLSEAMTQRLDDAVKVVPELEQDAAALREIFGSLTEITEPTAVQRVHGDLHLGQILRTVKGWKIVDFEGEPAKPLSERVRPDSPWRDVAGMLRSFDYAAHSVEADVEEGAQIAYRAAEWVERNQTAFLDGYLEASGRRAGGDLSEDQQLLLRAYVADKAVYEAVYETRNRPRWVSIPLSAIGRITSGEDSS